MNNDHVILRALEQEPQPVIITHEPNGGTMLASFTESGDLLLHPETTLERMAAKAFVQSMRHRNKPQILIDAGDGSTVPQGKNSIDVPDRPMVLIDHEAEVPGQQRIDAGVSYVSKSTEAARWNGSDPVEVARSVGGV